jgi:hypothetical protein
MAKTENMIVIFKTTSDSSSINEPDMKYSAWDTQTEFEEW